MKQIIKNIITIFNSIKNIISVFNSIKVKKNKSHSMEPFCDSENMNTILPFTTISNSGNLLQPFDGSIPYHIGSVDPFLDFPRSITTTSNVDFPGYFSGTTTPNLDFPNYIDVKIEEPKKRKFLKKKK